MLWRHVEDGVPGAWASPPEDARAVRLADGIPEAYDAGMRRLARIMLNVAIALLMALCAATVALWVRSYFVQDYAEALENYRGPSSTPGKFEFRNCRSTWD